MISGQLILRLCVVNWLAHAFCVPAVVFAADRQILIPWVDGADVHEIRLTVALDRISSLACSTDGQVCVVVSEAGLAPSVNHQFVIFDGRTGRQLQSFVGTHAAVPSVALSPAGHRLAYIRRGVDRGVFVRQIDDRRAAPDRLLDKDAVCVDWSDQGNRIAWLNQTNDALTLVVLDLVEDSRWSLRVSQSASVVDLSWDRLEKRIGVLAGDRVLIVDLKTSEIVETRLAFAATEIFCTSLHGFVLRSEDSLRTLEGAKVESANGVKFKKDHLALGFQGSVLGVIVRDTP